MGGDRFVPPGTSFSHVDKLRNLLKAEAEVHRQQKRHFLSAEFVVGDAGPLFPASWTDSLEAARGMKPRKAAEELARPEGSWLEKADDKADVEQLLRVATPAFEMNTQDGTKFRIYKSGSLEVRTTQECNDQEVVGAVFSIRTKAQGSCNGQKVPMSEKIVKVTEYVQSQNGEDEDHSYFVLMQGEQDNAVVTQRLSDGTLTWEENPTELADSCSLAKVIRAVECRMEKNRATFQDVKRFQAKDAEAILEGRMYAQRVFIQAVGGVSQMIRSNNIKAQSIEADAN